tara:strand:+ start:23 stop:274 length:252 start_codon:yes stop_codon:yes gene_type:complete
MLLFADSCLQKNVEPKIARIETSVVVEMAVFVRIFPCRPLSKSKSDNSVTKMNGYHLRFNCVKMHHVAHQIQYKSGYQSWLFA